METLFRNPISLDLEVFMNELWLQPWEILTLKPQHGADSWESLQLVHCTVFYFYTSNCLSKILTTLNCSILLFLPLLFFPVWLVGDPVFISTPEFEFVTYVADTYIAAIIGPQPKNKQDFLFFFSFFWTGWWVGRCWGGWIWGKFIPFEAPSFHDLPPFLQSVPQRKCILWQPFHLNLWSVLTLQLWCLWHFLVSVYCTEMVVGNLSLLENLGWRPPNWELFFPVRL